MSGTNKVKVRALENLKDDGIRDWDKQLIDELNCDYPGWENPVQTWMVPPVFNVKATSNNEGELAEKKVYDLLQEFGNTRKEPMFVVHSYNFREKLENWKDRRKDDEKYVKGEHDFVLVHRQQGVIFLQVKAAATTRQQFAAANKQLEKDKKSIQCFAGEHLNGTLKKKVNHELFSCPGYVVMPNCPRPNPALTSNGIFLQDCKDVQAFSSWWDKNILPAKILDQEVYNCMVKRYVGLHHGVPCLLGSSIKKSHNVLEWTTRQQLDVLVNQNAELWITGPAGSGKTWILMEKVKQLAVKALLHDSGEKILVVCYNLPLSKMLKKQFSDYLEIYFQDKDLDSVVEVKTFDKLLFDITDRHFESDDQKIIIKLIDDAIQKIVMKPPQYDYIFVDECQDLIGCRWPDLFQFLLKGDDDEDDCKHRWFFYDPNQYVGLPNNYLELKNALKKSIKLKVVLRNTGHIFDQSKKYLKPVIPNMEPIKLGHKECGLAIEWDRSLSSRNVPESEGAKEVVKHIDVLRRNKVLEKDICILVENEEVRERLSSELKALNVENQNADTLFEEDHKERVVVDSIRRFKGLESKVVILYNPPYFVCEDQPAKKVKELLYIAVSRCFCYLVIITTDNGCQALKSNDGVIECSAHKSQKPRSSSETIGSNNLINQMGSMQSSPTKRLHEEERETEPAVVRDLYQARKMPKK